MDLDSGSPVVPLVKARLFWTLKTVEVFKVTAFEAPLDRKAYSLIASYNGWPGSRNEARQAPDLNAIIIGHGEMTSAVSMLSWILEHICTSWTYRRCLIYPLFLTFFQISKATHVPFSERSFKPVNFHGIYVAPSTCKLLEHSSK